MVHHAKWQEAEDVLQLDLSFEIKQAAKEAVPEQDGNRNYQEIMVEMVHHKYKACDHAHTALLESKSEIAEATADKLWGTGLDMERTLECLPDYWPGQNLMG